MTEEVNHPVRYGGADDPYETIKVNRVKSTPQEYCGWLKNTIRRYIDRHAMKGGLQDFQKAQFYMNELVRYVAEVGHDNIWPKPFVVSETVVLEREFLDGKIELVEVPTPEDVIR